MSRTQPVRLAGAVVAIGAIGAVIGALALGGCGAGQYTQTSGQVAPAGAGTGSVLVRDARIEFGDDVAGANVYPRGGAAPLRMSIVNQGDGGDRLVSASSPAASAVRISGDTQVPAGQVLLVEGGRGAEPAATTGSTPASTAAPATGAAPGPLVAPPATTAKATDAVGQRKVQVVLTGLRDDIRAGLTYEVELVFERAGAIRLDVPVGNPSTPREDNPAAE